MNLIRRDQRQWDPFDLLTDLHDDINHLFSTSLKKQQKGDGFSLAFNPEIDITEEENEYVLKVDVPGMLKEDLDISVTGNVLTIKGQRKEESEKKEKNFYVSERRFGSFQRSVEFPTDVKADQIQASYKNGVLELKVPKSETSKPKQIKVELK